MPDISFICRDTRVMYEHAVPPSRPIRVRDSCRSIPDISFIFRDTRILLKFFRAGLILVEQIFYHQIAHSGSTVSHLTGAQILYVLDQSLFNSSFHTTGRFVFT